MRIRPRPKAISPARQPPIRLIAAQAINSRINVRPETRDSFFLVVTDGRPRCELKEVSPRSGKDCAAKL